MKEFWQSIIFYNYVQVSIDKARKSPTKDEFDLSKDAFYEILEYYKPDLVIVWGERLFNNMPITSGEWMEKKVCDIPYEKVYSYTIAGKKIPCYCVYHPASSKYSYDYYKLLDSFIKEW